MAFLCSLTVTGVDCECVSEDVQSRTEHFEVNHTLHFLSLLSLSVFFAASLLTFIRQKFAVVATYALSCRPSRRRSSGRSDSGRSENVSFKETFNSWKNGSLSAERLALRLEVFFSHECKLCCRPSLSLSLHLDVDQTETAASLTDEGFV